MALRYPDSDLVVDERLRAYETLQALSRGGARAVPSDMSLGNMIEHVQQLVGSEVGGTLFTREACDELTAAVTAKVNDFRQHYPGHRRS